MTNLPTKPFVLTKDMLTMGGAFYPTGYAFILFPSEADAQQAAQQLAGTSNDMMLLTPQEILQKVAHVDGESQLVDLPSVGTEGATVKKYAMLAKDGHHALMIAAPDAEATERIMTVVRTLPYTYAQQYHMLAIEDLE